MAGGKEGYDGAAGKGGEWTAGWRWMFRCDAWLETGMNLDAKKTHTVMMSTFLHGMPGAMGGCFLAETMITYSFRVRWSMTWGKKNSFLKNLVATDPCGVLPGSPASLRNGMYLFVFMSYRYEMLVTDEPVRLVYVYVLQSPIPAPS